MGCGSSSQTVNSSSSPPPQFAQAYQDILNMGEQAASQPLQQYGGKMVAGFDPAQMNAFNTINNSQGIENPFINAASQYAAASTTPLQSEVPQYSGAAISGFQSPYTSNVVNTTEQQMNNLNAQQQAQVTGNAASQGALGGDRVGVAQAQTAGQQASSEAPVLAGLENQGFTQAQGEFNQQQQEALSAAQANAWLNSQAGFQMGNLGQEAETGALTGANAQLGIGNQQQGLAQEQLNIPYEQFQAQQAYPFQTTNWLAGLAGGLGSEAGGTSSTTYPGPDILSELMGGGMAGLGLAGSMGWLKRGGAVKGFDSGGSVLPAVPNVDISIVGNPMATTPGKGPPPAPSVPQQPASQMPSFGGMKPPTTSQSDEGPFPQSVVPLGTTDITQGFYAPGSNSAFRRGGAPGFSPHDGKGYDGMPTRGMPRHAGFDIGGAVTTGDERRGFDTGGGALTSQTPLAGAGPNAQNYAGQLTSMPDEQLRELAMRMPPGSAQGSLVQRTLQQRKMNPGASPTAPMATNAPAASTAALAPSAMPAPMPAPASGMAPPGATAPGQQMSPAMMVRRGGPVRGFASGGGPTPGPTSFKSPTGISMPLLQSPTADVNLSINPTSYYTPPIPYGAKQPGGPGTPFVTPNPVAPFIPPMTPNNPPTAWPTGPQQPYLNNYAAGGAPDDDDAEAYDLPAHGEGPPAPPKVPDNPSAYDMPSMTAGFGPPQTATVSGSASPSAAPATAKRSPGFADSPWFPVFAAGAGMMAHGSHFAGENIGAGLLEGAKVAQGQAHAADDRSFHQMSVDEAAKRLSTELQMHQDTLSQSDKQHAAELDRQRTSDAATAAYRTQEGTNAASRLKIEADTASRPHIVYQGEGINPDTGQPGSIHYDDRDPTAKPIWGPSTTGKASAQTSVYQMKLGLANQLYPNDPGRAMQAASGKFDMPEGAIQKEAQQRAVSEYNSNVANGVKMPEGEEAFIANRTTTYADGMRGHPLQAAPTPSPSPAGPTPAPGNGAPAATPAQQPASQPRPPGTPVPTTAAQPPRPSLAAPSPSGAPSPFAAGPPGDAIAAKTYSDNRQKDAAAGPVTPPPAAADRQVGTIWQPSPNAPPYKWTGQGWVQQAQP